MTFFKAHKLHKEKNSRNSSQENISQTTNKSKDTEATGLVGGMQHMKISGPNSPGLTPVSSANSIGVRLISLRLASPAPDLNIANILPLYHMYQATVQRGLTPLRENYRVEPPTYETSHDLSPINSAPNSGTEYERPPLLSTEDNHLFPVESQASTPGFPPPELDDTDEQNKKWEDTLLANIHKLKNLSNTNNAFLDALNVEIHPTLEFCQKDVVPTPVDLEKREFRQGEYLHGYVTVENTLNKPIPFDMFYVVFEGTITCLKPPPPNVAPTTDRKPGLVYKFLNMVDLYALWSYANIDRLASDNGDPHDWCEGDTDWDGSLLSITYTRMLQPGTKYKRFFTFRIPNKLLDDACEPHDMTWHQELLPSVGTSNGTTHMGDLRDFGFVDALVAYRLEARVIGLADYYNVQSKKDKGKEYVIAKDSRIPIRIIPDLDPINNLRENREEMKIYYRAFINEVNEKLNLGRELLILNREEFDAARANGGVASSSALSPVSSFDLIKQKQFYPFKSHELDLKLRRKPMEEYYQGIIKYKKKNLTGLGRTLGILLIATPKIYHHISYLIPARYLGVDENPPASATTVKLPIIMSFSDQNQNQTAPEIKDLQVEVVAVTIKSPHYPIAVPFTHDQLFDECNIDSPRGTFDTIVVKDMVKKIQELTDLLKKNGSDVFLVEQELFKDMKSIALCNSKYSLVIITDMRLLSLDLKTSNGTFKSVGVIPWTVNKETGEQQKRFQIEFDVAQGKLKQTNGTVKKGEFCLIPDFQLCHMARFYFIKVTARTSSSQSVSVNAPMIVENFPIIGDE